MLTTWQWGVRAFLAAGWSISELGIAWGSRHAAEERAQLLREMYGDAIAAWLERAPR